MPSGSRAGISMPPPAPPSRRLIESNGCAGSNARAAGASADGTWDSAVGGRSGLSPPPGAPQPGGGPASGGPAGGRAAAGGPAGGGPAGEATPRSGDDAQWPVGGLSSAAGGSVSAQP